MNRKLFFSILLLSSTFFCFANSTPIDTTKKYIVTDIAIEGNSITKERIIQRELDIHKGDSLCWHELVEKIKQSEKNLMNLSLFHFVNIDYKIINSEKNFNNVKIIIKIAERWYIWPMPITLIEERNINEWWKNKNLEKLSYGMSLLVENFRGRNETLSIGAQTGFNEQYNIVYQIPNMNSKQNIGLGFSANYVREHNIIYNSIDNHPIWLKADNEHIFENIFLQLALTQRQGIFKSHTLRLQFNNLWISDTLFNVQSLFIENVNKSTSYFTFSYFLKHDYRDYKHYPLEGHYFDIEVSKRGLPILSNNNVSTLQVYSNLRKYWKIHESLYYACGMTTQLRFDKNKSFLFNKALGYGRDYLRGYENYVIDGQNFALIKSNIKYNIVKPNIKNIKFIPWTKFNTIPYAFYLNVHTDFAYVWDKYYYANNPLSNTALLGYGIGIDFVTYYNSTYRFDVSRNIRNEWTISLQFTAPI